MVHLTTLAVLTRVGRVRYGRASVGRLLILTNGEIPMIFLVDERAAALSANSSTASPRCAGLADAQETKPHVFASKPKASLSANVLRLRLG